MQETSKLADEQRIAMQAEVVESVRGLLALAIERFGKENAAHIVGTALGTAAKSLHALFPGVAEKIVADITKSGSD